MACSIWFWRDMISWLFGSFIVFKYKSSLYIYLTPSSYFKTFKIAKSCLFYDILYIAIALCTACLNADKISFFRLLWLILCSLWSLYTEKSKIGTSKSSMCSCASSRVSNKPLMHWSPFSSSLQKWLKKFSLRVKMRTCYLALN